MRLGVSSDTIVNTLEQAALLREIFGNPFRLLSRESHWTTPTVLSLADSIYENRDFDRLPLLADALEEAGCDNADILAHCRGPGPHVRGCWVVDLFARQGVVSRFTVKERARNNFRR